MEAIKVQLVWGGEEQDIFIYMTFKTTFKLQVVGESCCGLLRKIQDAYPRKGQQCPYFECKNTLKQFPTTQPSLQESVVVWNGKCGSLEE